MRNDPRFQIAPRLYLCSGKNGYGWIATSKTSDFTPDKEAVKRGCKLAEELGYAIQESDSFIRLTPLGDAMLKLTQ